MLPPIVVIFPVNVISFGLVVSGVTTTNSSISYFDGDAAGTGVGDGGGGGGDDAAAADVDVDVDGGADVVDADAVNPGTGVVGAAAADADVDVGAAANPDAAVGDPYTDDGVVDISNYKREFFKSFLLLLEV